MMCGEWWDAKRITGMLEKDAREFGTNYRKGSEWVLNFSLAKTRDELDAFLMRVYDKESAINTHNPGGYRKVRYEGEDVIILFLKETTCFNW